MTMPSSPNFIKSCCFIAFASVFCGLAENRENRPVQSRINSTALQIFSLFLLLNFKHALVSGSRLPFITNFSPMIILVGGIELAEHYGRLDRNVRDRLRPVNDAIGPLIMGINTIVALYLLKKGSTSFQLEKALVLGGMAFYWAIKGKNQLLTPNRVV